MGKYPHLPEHKAVMDTVKFQIRAPLLFARTIPSQTAASGGRRCRHGCYLALDGLDFDCNYYRNAAGRRKLFHGLDVIRFTSSLKAVQKNRSRGLRHGYPVVPRALAVD